MCPHSTLCVSSFHFIYVLILLNVFSYCCICPHTTIYVLAFYSECVLVSLYICPHTTKYVLAYYYIYIYMIFYHISTVY
jgi:hypothetical protein